MLLRLEITSVLIYVQILFAYEDERGEDVVEAIDFWKNNRKSDAFGSLQQQASVSPPR